MAERIEPLVCTQQTLGQKIVTVITNGKKTSLNKRTLGFYQTKHNELEKLWDEFSKIDTELRQLILIFGQENETPYIKNDVFGTLEVKYSEYAGELIDGIAEKSPMLTLHQSPNVTTEANRSQTHAPQTFLPRINLPKFNGDYQHWKSFHDYFLSVVHNNPTLENVQKLHYLKGCLIGEADRLLSHIPITNDDYQPAWDKLKLRYDNKRVLINTQLKRLVNQPKSQSESSKGLRALEDTTEECMQQLKSLKVTTESWDTLLIHILLQNVPISTLKLWEEELGDVDKLPSLPDFLEFLQTRARILESIANTLNSKPVESTSTKAYHTISNAPIHGKCAACSERHYIATCAVFRRMNAIERKNCITKAGNCFNCLSGNHSIKNCHSNYSCHQCKGRHHTLLHVYNTERKFSPGSQGSQGMHTPRMHNSNINQRQQDGETAQEGVNLPHVKNFFSNEYPSGLLATVQVRVSDSQGHMTTCRCLIDSGSQASFITENAFHKLGLKGKPTTIVINGLNQVTTSQSNYKVKAALQSRYHDRDQIKVNLLVISKITELLPSTAIPHIHEWTHLQGLNLADPDYWQPGHIDMLLGVEVYAEIVKGNIVKGPKDTPIAMETKFGWILLGKVSTTANEVHTFFTTNHWHEEMSKKIANFWETEEITKPPPLSAEDQACQTWFTQTHTRLKNGQYQVRLPFKNTKPTLGASRMQAERRFQQLNRKLSIDSKLKQEYSKCLNEYITLQHMTKISCNNDPTGYFIPHHAVFKESTTTKLRVVFDASAKSENGKSLNEQLLIGPTIQPKLSATLLKWRKYKVAMTADIEKMYRMILIHPDDRKFQKILWNDPQTNQKQEFQLNTVTFGTSAAPFLAIRTLQQLAVDEAIKWPLAAAQTNTDFYVDDLLTGADTVQEAKRLQHQYLEMLKSGHFRLRKWASNVKEALADLPLEYVELKDHLTFQEHDAIKTLGIRWIPHLDYFTFKIKQQPNSNIITKRKMLSEIASLYDPLGWIAPVIVVAKILMQKLWLCGCTWDAEVAKDIQPQWKIYQECLSQLETLKIPRWIGFAKGIQNIQLHGFSDASMSAYAAVVYVRITDEHGNVNTTMLTAKTKVASIKPVTIPRLELCGAALLAKLLHITRQDLQLSTVPIIAWTDSMIVLHWVKNHPAKWKTYVANRVVEIQEMISPDKWRHVPTADNPADLASRGLAVSELCASNLWWSGPTWLKQTPDHWPTTTLTTESPLAEKKERVNVNFTTQIDTTLMSAYSSFYKLKRIIATIRRFAHNCKPNRLKKFGALTAQELNQATNTICTQVQKSALAIEYATLSDNKQLKNNNQLRNLAPFLDQQGIMRVGGRLEHANLTYERKHPIILPSDHVVVRSLINDLHKETLHGGVSLVLNTSRNKFWILNAKRIISQQINKCPRCIRYRQQTKSQAMGNLPVNRFNNVRPFINVGIDYAGPISLRAARNRNSKTYKGYFCIFVCMSTKAIHLELVSDLTSAAFIAALKRFVARRGICTNIHSDCGTNFKGAEVTINIETRNAIAQGINEAQKSFFGRNQITWHFNPPAAPHFGGLWEAGVKSVKHHLRRVIVPNLLTYEEYATLLTQIEACLNSRPLCRIENSKDDLTVLTPGHFLIGQALTSVPEPGITEGEITFNKRWKHIQYMMQQFWKGWSRDYLNQLQQRNKWKEKQTNVTKGDIVIIKEDNTAPTYWPLAFIENLYPGSDGLIRVVDVRTSTKLYKRPITKLCVVPT